MDRLFPKKFVYFFIILLIFSPLINIGFSLYFINTEVNNKFNNLRISSGVSDVDTSILPDIDYTSLNDAWYNPKIEMLIICPDNQSFIDAVKPLMEWKNEKGVKTIILSNFSLYNGVDDAERIRNMIKWYYERENIRWVLLAGDAQNDIIPIRKVYNPDVLRYGEGRTETVGSEYLKATDYYYADLNGTWNSDGDENWGEAPQDNAYGLDEITWDPEVYVGRLPASNAGELEMMVNKTLKYETNPEVGDWMNRMLLAGGISDTTFEAPPDGEDESRLTTYIWQNYVASEMNFTHLWRSTYYTPPDPKDPLTSTSFRKEINNSYSTVIFAGHGSPWVYADASGTIYMNSDAKNIENTNNPSLIYADACSTSSYDLNDDNIGEYLIKRQNAGAIGYIGGLRVTWYYIDDTSLGGVNRGNAKHFWKEFFINEKFQQGRALYDSKISYMNSEYYTTGIMIGTKLTQGATYLDFERKQLLTYCLLGDPDVDIYTNIPKPVLNPFTDNIYEGQLVSISIQDNDSTTIPYARVHLETSDGKYHTVYADENGLASFRLPAQENEFYNVTITGHNLIKSHFNFTTLPDNTPPELIGVDYYPKKLSTTVNITFTTETHDNYSGIKSTFIILSKTNFTTYLCYGSHNDLEENNELFAIFSKKLTPGEYCFLVAARDYANNTIIFKDSIFNLSIPTSIMDYVFLTSLIIIIAVVGISVFVLFKGSKKISRIAKENRELS